MATIPSGQVAPYYPVSLVAEDNVTKTEPKQGHVHSYREMDYPPYFVSRMQKLQAID